jgi:hypothetical protein
VCKNCSAVILMSLCRGLPVAKVGGGGQERGDKVDWVGWWMGCQCVHTLYSSRIS